ncbi:Integral membrane protein OS=Streptomyces glaucescens OX=1907 GN=SGLAU_24315 PE=4 SV=1 [Streptomyces glaucescens]
MLALRLTRNAHPAVQLRRLLVAAASAGTGFLMLSAFGYALGHPEEPAGSLMLRLAWCATPLAATVHLAVAVARTDPATAPRPGLSAVGLGPARLMAVSATTTALAATLGSLLALLVFLHLRGDLTGLPFDGAAADFLAAGRPLPLPAALTLLAVIPVISSLAVALTLRPRDPRTASPGPRHRFGRFGAFGGPATRETFGAYGRFGARFGKPRAARVGPGLTAPAAAVPQAPNGVTAPDGTVLEAERSPVTEAARTAPPAPQQTPTTLPWGVATLAAGLAVEAYAGHTGTPSDLTMPSGLTTGPVGVLLGWVLTAVGLALAGPGLTHLCGRLLQSARPGGLRLLAGRALMAEADRIGRPLGVVCAVASAAYALDGLQDPAALGPLTVLGALVVAGCALATLLTAAVESRQARSDTTAALLRLGAPATVLRGAAVLRAGALLALFGPLTLIVAALAAQPLAR